MGRPRFIHCCVLLYKNSLIDDIHKHHFISAQKLHNQRSPWVTNLLLIQGCTYLDRSEM